MLHGFAESHVGFLPFQMEQAASLLVSDMYCMQIIALPSLGIFTLLVPSVFYLNLKQAEESSIAVCCHAYVFVAVKKRWGGRWRCCMPVAGRARVSAQPEVPFASCRSPAPPPGNAGDELLDQGMAAAFRWWDVVVPCVACWRNQPCHSDWQNCDG